MPDRDPSEPTEIAARYRVVEELLGERATNRSVVWGEGPSPLARALSALAFGDLVSVYLAILYQTDPTPVTLLAMLKERLARATDGRAPREDGAGTIRRLEGSHRAIEHHRQGREGDALRA